MPTGTASSLSTYRPSPGRAARAVPVVVAAALMAAAGTAYGQASPSGGGTAYVAKPVVNTVKCTAKCLSGGRVEAGGKLRLTGSKLKGVTQIAFLGGSGTRDDVAVDVNPTSDRKLAVTVPFGAQSGRLQAWAGRRVKSRVTAPVKITVPPPPEPSAEPQPLPGNPQVETATNRSTFFLGARGGVSFVYRVKGEAPTNVQVALVRVNDGTLVQSWTPPPAPPGEIQKVSWQGAGTGGVAPEGRYAFRISTEGGDGVRAAEANGGDPNRDSFDFHGHIFPVRGTHNFGGAGAQFGAGRAGHSHQGQDVMARCGTRMVAARSGVVKAKQYQAAAGHYLVIDGDLTGVDYFYAHLASASPLAKGDRVYTGQQIGVVGESGNAQGCHLHYEMWGAPGWYSGGRPFDPLPDLKAWDAVS